MRKPFGPFTIAILMPEARSAFVPPREVEMVEVLPEPEKAEPVEVAPVSEDVMAVRPPEEEPEPVEREKILKEIAATFDELERAEPPEDPEDGAGRVDEAVVSKAVPCASANRPPRYPRLARRLGYEGRVILEVEVLTDGSVGEVRVVEVTGHRVFAQAAMRAVREWRFAPARTGGRALTTRVMVPVRFRIEEARQHG